MKKPKRRGRKAKVIAVTPLAHAMEELEMGYTELSKLVESSPQQIERLAKGLRKMTREWAERLGPHVNRSPNELIFGSEQVLVVGKVGGGGNVQVVDDHAPGAGYEEIDRPAGVTGPVVALIIDGDSMFPRYKHGEYLLHGYKMPPDGLTGRECVIWLADGRVLVKELQRGADGTFSLYSHNAPPIENVEVVAAAEVVARVNRRAR